MDSGGEDTQGSARNPALRAIASGLRREALGTLLERDSPMTERSLATHLTVTERKGPGADVTAPEVGRLRTELAHVHLPMLADAGFVARNRADATVETTAHPALADPRFRRLLELEADGLDGVLSTLSHERRRIALSVLRNARRPMSRAELAGELLRRESGTREPDPAAVERVTISLHNVHFPKLADLRLVEYDAGTDRVAYANHPTLEEVFGTIHEPDRGLLEKFDGFLGGLETSYRQAGRDTGERLDWPHFWRDPHHG